MAKPTRKADLSVGMRAGKAAARILRAQLANVREHAPVALAGEVEGIHDMRVSVKRLRESMRLFRRLLPAKRRDRVMPRVELLNDTLGPVRERDVLCLDAEELGREVADDGGLTAITTGVWQTERAQAFAHFQGVWERMVGEGFFEAVEDVERRTRRRRRAANCRTIDCFAADAAREALGRVEERLPPALESDDPALLHRLRIGVKRLKYSIEPFCAILPLLKEPYKAVWQAQELLGLTHDLDVLRDGLAGHLAEIGQDRLGGAESLLRLLDERRGERYAQSREAITILAAPGFRRALMDAID